MVQVRLAYLSNGQLMTTSQKTERAAMGFVLISHFTSIRWSHLKTNNVQRQVITYDNLLYSYLEASLNLEQGCQT